MNLALTPCTILTFCEDKEHLCGILFIFREQQRNPHIQGKSREHSPDGIRVDVTLRIEIATFNDNYRARCCFCHGFDLAEQIPVDQRIHKIPHGFTLNEDPVTDRIIPMRKPFKPDGSTHFGEHFDHF